MPSNPFSRGPFGLPRLVVWGGSVLILVLVSFAVGVAVGSRPVDELTRGMEQAQARAGATESRAAALEALSLLYGTLLDVDARNFGTANERLDSATAALGRANSAALEAAVRDTLLRELKQLDVRVATDLAAQRATLARLAQRLAQALGV